MRTQVAIIGSGPSGLLLSHLLAAAGVESVIVENRSREYVEARIRAGVIEHGAVDTLVSAGVGERLLAEGQRHDGIYLQWPGERHRIDFPALCGRSVWVYGQTEITRDLIAAAPERGLEIVFEAEDLALHDVDSAHPFVTYSKGGETVVVECDLIAGCDGFHGPSRRAIPAHRFVSPSAPASRCGRWPNSAASRPTVRWD